MLHAQLVGGAVPAREVHAHRLDPVGRAAGEALLVHLLAGDAGGEAVQHARPVPQRPHRPVGDGDVVLREVELGLAAGREVDAVGVGDPHGAAVDLQLDRRPGARHRAQRRQAFRRRITCPTIPASDAERDEDEPDVLRVALVRAGDERDQQDDRDDAADDRALGEAAVPAPLRPEGSSSGETSEDFATSRELLATAVSSHNNAPRMMGGDDW